MLLLLLVLILLFGLPYGGYRAGFSPVTLIIVVVVLLILFGGLGAGFHGRGYGW